MDKSWIDENDRFSSIFINGVESFLKFSRENDTCADNKILCPCNDCRNTKRKSFLEVKRDLHLKGFCSNYKTWIYHGESKVPRSFPITQDFHTIDDIERMDELFEMIEEMRDAEPDQSYDSGIQNFERLLSDIKRELYPSCKKYSLLSFIVKLLHIKVMNKMTDKTMNLILELIKDILPEGNIVPPSLYSARKLLFGIGLGYEKIDVCKYDCSLFWKENEQEESCPVCKEPRWMYNDGKSKRTPHKILRYFPLKSRLQRLFMSSKTASDMRWHAEKHIDIEGTLSHPADSLSWKDFNLQHPTFAADARNVRLGLATDGFNPFGNMSNSYSMWPIILIPYNMPLYKCMKDEFFMMSLLIPGPQAPGKDIDVFLRPLIDELKELWNGVETYDACKKEKFQMRAIIMWTINDFPALSNLFGWTTKGYMACPCCLYMTDSRKLRSKICYMRHRRYLERDHPYRKSKKFDGPRAYLTKFYSGCIINGVRFHTKDRDDRRTTQNSGLLVEGEHKNNMTEFYGFLTRVVELTYLHGYKVVLFQCEWYNTSNLKKSQKDKHFVSVDTRSRWYKDDPFVLPSQVKQIFYVNDTKLGHNWKIVQYVQHRHLWDITEHEDVGVEAAFQQHESNGVALLVEDEADDLEYLAREDIDADIVDEEVLQAIRQQRLHEISVDENESIDEGDETIMEYCDEDDDNLHNPEDEPEEDE